MPPFNGVCMQRAENNPKQHHPERFYVHGGEEHGTTTPPPILDSAYDAYRGSKRLALQNSLLCRKMLLAVAS